MPQSLITLGSILILLLICLAFAFIRGLTKARIRAVSIILCAVAAFALTMLIKNSLTSLYDTYAENLHEIMVQMNQEEFWNFITDSEAFRNALAESGAAIAAPMLFVAIFLALRIVTWIIYFIVTLLLHGSIKRHDADRRLRSVRTLVWGVVQCIVILFVITTPIAAYMEFAPQVLNSAKEAGAFDDADPSLVQQVESIDLEEMNKNPLLNTYRSLGGSLVTKQLTKFKANGEDAQLADEMESLSGFAFTAMKLSKSGGVETYGEKEAALIEALSASFGDSKLLPTLAGELIYSATDKWTNNEKFLGAEKPSVGEILDPAFDTLLNDFHADAKENELLRKDFDTLAKMVSLLARDGVLANVNNQDELINKLAGGDTVKNLIDLLGQNATLKNLIPEFTNIGMRAIGSMLNLPENAAEIYDQFIGDVTDAVNTVLSEDLTQEEKIEKLTSQLSDALADSGVDVEIDESVVSLYAGAILTDIEEKGITSVEDADIQSFFEIYADIQNETEETAPQDGTVAYTVPLDKSQKTYAGKLYAGKTLQELKEGSGVAVLANVTVEIAKESKNAANDESFRDTVREIINKHVDEYAKSKPETAAALRTNISQKIDSFTTVSISEESVKNAASIKADSFPTVIVTVDALLVDTKEATAMLTGDAISEEAKNIGDIFSTALQLKDKLPENSDLSGLSEVAESLGSILDTLTKTASFGEEKTATLVTAVFQSDMVSGSMNLDVKTATELARQATTSTDSKPVSYAETMKSVSRGAAIAEKISKSDEEITEDDIRELLRDMTPQTANMMKVYITADRVTGYGIPEERAVASAELLQNLFAEMAVKEKYGDRYEDQTNAIVKIFDLATAASKASGDYDSLFNHGSADGRLKMTAKETVELIMDSEMVCNATVATLTKDDKVLEDKINPFGLNIPEDSNDYRECRAAIDEYYDAHKATRQNLDVLLNAVAALLGLSSVNFAG